MGKNYAQLLSQPLVGAAGGYAERSQLTRTSIDGVNLDDYWDEVQQVLAVRNANLDRMIAEFSSRTTEFAVQVDVPAGVANFEVASEYGQPKAYRNTYSRRWRGLSFNFYDIAIRYTNMFLAEATRVDLDQLTQEALDADRRLLYNLVMKRLFNPLNETGMADNDLPVTVYGLYNGDGEVPPAYESYTFTGTHSHYVTTQSLRASATLTPACADDLELKLSEHGYSYAKGYRLIMWVNQQELNTVKTWRVANGATYDYIPDPSTYNGGVYVANNMTLVGQPAGRVEQQVGTYGPWHVVLENQIPAGYVVALAAGGPENPGNPVMLREHRNPSYRGLQIIPGARATYPLVDSFYQRGWGTGIKYRGAGAICQVTSSATYAIPAAFANVP